MELIMRKTANVPIAKNRLPTEVSESNAAVLFEAAQDVLKQGLSLLSDLGDSSYARVAGPPFDTSIGQHYRHVLEHFQCFLEGQDAGEINYDARKRNRRLEKEVRYASNTTCEILQTLARCSEENLAQNCKAITSLAYSSSAPCTLNSNAGRELAYCIGHAIHHYALIRLVAGGIGITVSDEFGFAPSTLKHMAAHAAD
jgi:hypothetical protein